jgi:hypothetical protein
MDDSAAGRENSTGQDSVSQQNPLETGRVPQVRQSVPGPKMVFSNAFTRGGTPNLEPEIKALVGGKAPVVFVPGPGFPARGTTKGRLCGFH